MAFSRSYVASSIMTIMVRADVDVATDMDEAAVEEASVVVEVAVADVETLYMVAAATTVEVGITMEMVITMPTGKSTLLSDRTMMHLRVHPAPLWRTKIRTKIRLHHPAVATRTARDTANISDTKKTNYSEILNTNHDEYNDLKER